MIKSLKSLKAFVGFCIILLQVSNSRCTDLSPSVVKISWNLETLCSGILVKENFVLTSATCLRQIDPSELLVVANFDYTVFTNTGIATVVDIYRPEEYDEGSRYMDVAMLKLAKPLVGPEIGTAKLCTEGSIEVGAPVTLYNWDIYAHGFTEAMEQVALLKTNLTISESDLCAQKYEKASPQTNFCAANNKASTCLYDKSGPATVSGVFCAFYNNGPKCIEKSNPGLFTNLADQKVQQFINATLQK